MAIENRNLPVGTRLVATFKKQTYVCTVEEGEDGKRAYVVEGGKRFTSPSAAGSAVMGGVACNGWRWWSVEGAEPVKASKPARIERPVMSANTAVEGTAERKRRAKGYRIIRRVANQHGVSEGKVRYFCDACMRSFEGRADEAPTVCPEGHDAADPQFAREAE